jgi:hypothetical protein
MQSMDWQACMLCLIAYGAARRGAERPMKIPTLIALRATRGLCAHDAHDHAPRTEGIDGRRTRLKHDVQLDMSNSF